VNATSPSTGISMESISNGIRSSLVQARSAQSNLIIESLDEFGTGYVFSTTLCNCVADYAIGAPSVSSYN
jgi:hypothetical protein